MLHKRNLLQLLLFSLVYISFLSSFVQNVKNTRHLSRSSRLHMGGVPVVPYYPNKGSKDYQWMDIYNALGRDRTLFVGRFLDEENCNQLIASLIWLQGYVCLKKIIQHC